MANDLGPCTSKYDNWQEAMKEWDRLDSAANKALKNAIVKAGIALVVCGLTWETVVGLIPCFVTGANAVNDEIDSIDASLARNAAIDKANNALQAYKDCIEEHKWYYGK
jgi:hypothetical protein